MSLIVVMGVSGCGKSTLAMALAQALDIPFIEGDVLHPKSNIEKMSQSIPLTDEDRLPWLTILGERLAIEQHNKGAVLACSALKKSYRDLLRKLSGGNLKFIFVHGDEEFLEKRMRQRTNHFMPLSLLATQLATLEDPSQEAGVLKLDCTLSKEVATEMAVNWLNNQNIEA